MTLLTNGRVVTPDGILDPGWLRVHDGRIAALGEGEGGEDAVAPRVSHGAAGDELAAGEPLAEDLPVDLGGAWLVPGFVDMHVHGGGGAAYTSGDPEDARAAAAFHRAHGTTTTLASLVSAPVEELEATVAALAPLVEEGVIAGIHLEGPWLSARHHGAHDPQLLAEPDLAGLERLLQTGLVRMVTVAPELPGGLELIECTVAAGAVAAIGHTDATYAEARDAFAAGARVATHLHNAMRSPHHREPGPVAAALEDERVVVELINDGVHLHDAVARLALAVAGPDRVALVTDAMAAAGMPDGEYTLGTLGVEVSGGVARVAGGGAIAGSTLTMDVAFRRAAAELGLPVGGAVRAAATTPARVLGLDTGALAAGLRADLVVLDDDLALRAVMVAGGPLQRRETGDVERTGEAWKAAPPGSAGIASGAAR